MRLIAACALLLTTALACAQVRVPLRPVDGYIVDHGHLLSHEARGRISRIASAADREVKAPIMVLTIPSLASVGAKGWSIEGYAQHVFDTWGIGSAQYNRGVLLLVSKNDRKARIELGAEWKRTSDGKAKGIMNRMILPWFRREDYDTGVVSGVEGIDRMVRGRFLYTPQQLLDNPLLLFGGLILIVLIIKWFTRRFFPEVYHSINSLSGVGGSSAHGTGPGYWWGGGSGGWGGGGGGYGGGGFSGGGGASGSW
jgi:uncharacterized protein